MFFEFLLGILAPCYAKTLGRPVFRLVSLLLLTISPCLRAQPEPAIDFVRDVAPILQKHCLKCHSDTNPKGDLSLTSFKSVVEGGHVTPGKPAESLLLDVVFPAGDGKKPRMPKEGESLSREQVDTLRNWIGQGAKWPDGVVLQERQKADKNWWSLRPIAQAEPKTEAELREFLQGNPFPPGWETNPIDRYILTTLHERGLTPSPAADKRTLLRRVTFDLTGLPPSPEEVDAYINDQAADAYERVVDRLLASPHYGEQWGRHWLDVARFGESTGFERNVIIDNAWPFRDYVIKSFNRDKPFDRLILEHIAGDVLSPGDPDVAVGTTFLVCGPYDNVGNQDAVAAAQIRANTIDDMIRATSEAFLGMTIGCARCHDHKFDPIPQSDYYRLYTAFSGVNHGSRVIASNEQIQTRARQLKPLEEQRQLLTAEIAKLRKEIQTRADQKTKEVEARWVRPRPDRKGTEEIFKPIEAKYVRLIVDSLDTDPQRKTGFNLEEFEVWTSTETPRNVALAANGAKAEGSSRVASDFVDAYRASHVIDGRFGDRWIAAGPELLITLPAVETIQRVWFSSDHAGDAGQNSVATFVGDYRIEVSMDGKAWTKVADSFDRKPCSPAHAQKRIYDQEITQEERERLGLYDNQLARAQTLIAAFPSLPNWWVGTFTQPASAGAVFFGGDPQKKGPEVLASSLETLSHVSKPYILSPAAPEADRRLLLARWLVAPENPLTPRVLANRIWQHHFGTGLVETPSDFGMMGAKPSHPELLDWLANRLKAEGWRLKHLHKLILMSQTYRQSSTYRDAPAKVDGASRLLWRYPPRRLSAEELRDTLLSVGGKLDKRMGGPGFRLYRYLEDNVATYIPLDEPGPETFRRSVYHQSGRAARVDLLSDFDCPDNASPAPARGATTSPLQALTMLNHKFNLDVANAFAQRLVREVGAEKIDDQVKQAYILAYGREPNAKEQAASVEFVKAQGTRAFARVILNSNELLFVR